MGKAKLLIFTVIMSALILFVGCVKKVETDRKIIQNGDKKITVIQDTNYIKEEDVVEKIHVYEGVKGYGWIDDGNILGIKENAKMKSEIEVGVYDLKNVPNLKEKIISAENLPYQFINISPDKKHIFYVNQPREKGYILDLKGNIKAEAKGPYMSELAEARWFNNEGLVMPYKDTGFYSINMDGKKMKIGDVENEEYIYKSIKLGNRIYYCTQIGLERKMKVYDISKKEKKLFIEDRVTNFYLSPKGNHIITETHNLKQDKTMLSIVDMEGKNKETVAEGRMIYGSSWSPDGLKFAFIINSRGEDDEGLFVIDIKKKKKNHLSTEYLDLQSDIKWSPSGNKIMISNGEVKEGKWIDNIHIITLK